LGGLLSYRRSLLQESYLLRQHSNLHTLRGLPDDHRCLHIEGSLSLHASPASYWYATRKRKKDG
jgi:hypothetical protein